MIRHARLKCPDCKKRVTFHIFANGVHFHSVRCDSYLKIEPPFRNLTLDEFNGLTKSEKQEYLIGSKTNREMEELSAEGDAPDTMVVFEHQVRTHGADPALLDDIKQYGELYWEDVALRTSLVERFQQLLKAKSAGKEALKH